MQQVNIRGGCASTSTPSAKSAVWFHVLQALQLLALQVWACAQYAQAYCLLLGLTCSLLQLLRAGRGALPGQRTVSGNVAARCAHSGRLHVHGHLAEFQCLAIAVRLAMLCC